MQKLRTSKGLTLSEIVIVLAIFILITSIGTYAFVNTQKKKQLDVTTDTIAGQLDKAKENAMAGKSGKSFGIKFNSTSTVAFSGNSYDGSQTSNVTWAIPSSLTLSNNISNTDKSILFTRITGIPQYTGTITITDSSNSISESIIIGDQGEISVIK